MKKEETMGDPSTPAKVEIPDGYAEWLAELKGRIHNSRHTVARKVNQGLLILYWQIGRDILDRQAEQGWGAKVIDRLAQDLRTAFPEMKGFSRANLLYMRAFAEAWPETEIVQQLVGQLPWGAQSSPSQQAKRQGKPGSLRPQGH